jgi:hypothetical protein
MIKETKPKNVSKEFIARRNLISIVEATLHFLLHCHCSWCFWSKVIQWWGISTSFLESLEDFYNKWLCYCSSKFQVKAWKLVFFATLWIIWLTRNNLVFNSVQLEWPYLFQLLAHRISVWIHKIEGNFTYTRLDLT